jgi:hypothetical protein
MQRRTVFLFYFIKSHAAAISQLTDPKNSSALFLESTHPAEAGKGSAMPTKKPTRRH